MGNIKKNLKSVSKIRRYNKFSAFVPPSMDTISTSQASLCINYLKFFAALLWDIDEESPELAHKIYEPSYSCQRQNLN